MARQMKKTKEQFTLTVESKLLRAAETAAARRKISRIAWIAEAMEDKLRALGKLP